jgi:hypothetical protein
MHQNLNTHPKRIKVTLTYIFPSAQISMFQLTPTVYTGRLMAGTKDLYSEVLVLIQTAISNYFQGPFLPEKLTIARLLKKFPKLYGIQ